MFNAVTSIYGRANALTKLLSNAIQKQNNGETAVFYLDTERAAALYSVARVTMPKMPSTRNGYVASITDADSPVKLKIGNVTESQQFKRWFGDWQNDPAHASRAVNEDGTPKVVYHGTNAELTVFNSSDGTYWFSESRDYAESMAEERSGDVLMQAFLDKMMKVSLAAISKKAEPVESKE